MYGEENLRSRAAEVTEKPMNAKQTLTRLAPGLSITCLLLSMVLFVACAGSRSYPGPVHRLTFNGTIKSIDSNEHRLTVAPLKPGELVVFLWNDSTKFWKQGVPIKSDSLEPTWPVRVHYHTSSGQSTAHHVYMELSYPVVH